MVAPTFETDLVDVTLAESTTGWTAIGSGGAGLSASPDLSMQGTNCIDKQVSNGQKGAGFNFTGGVLGNDDHIFVWVFIATPGLLDTDENGGLSICLGADEDTYNSYHVEGNNTLGVSGRVGRCYGVKWLQSAFSLQHPYVGSTGAGIPTQESNVTFIGARATTVASVKAPNLGIDAIRIGRGHFVYNGEPGDPITFENIATWDNEISRRYGILLAFGGSYELQGEFNIGQNNLGVPQASFFSAVGDTVALVDSIHGAADFTQINIDGDGTEFNLVGCTIKALGTINRGQFSVLHAGAFVALEGTVFDGMGDFLFAAGVIADGCSFLRCGTILQNDATIDSCDFIDANTSVIKSVIVTDNPSLIQNCTFRWDTVRNIRHAAVEILTPGTYTWSSTSQDFAATGQNGATILNRSGGLVTINVTGDGDTPTYRNEPVPAGSTTIVNAGSATVKIIVIDAVTLTLLQDCRVLILAGSTGSIAEGTVLVEGTTDVNGEIEASRSYPADQSIVGRVRRSTSGDLYRTASVIGTVNSGTGLILTVQMIRDE